MKITTIGIDLAKTVFQVHGVDERGKAVLRKQLKRKDLLSFFANLEPCLIGMEACGSAHYWARKLSELGHTVRLMAPQFVKPYVKTNKSDRNDAEAICEAVGRPNMRFVSVKTAPMQAVLARAPSAPGIRQGTHCARQPDSRLARRVRDRDPQGHRSHQQALAGDPGRRREADAGVDSVKQDVRCNDNHLGRLVGDDCRRLVVHGCRSAKCLLR